MPLDLSAMRARARAIRLAVFDVDGVLTDGRLILGPRGEEYKAFHVRDGHGLVELRRAGITVAIITGRRSEVVDRRMQELGVEHVYQGVGDKAACLGKLLVELGISADETCYTGDDLPDLGALKMVGLAFTVADAVVEAQATAHAITRLGGGRGAVREICDLLLTARAERHDPAAPTS